MSGDNRIKKRALDDWPLDPPCPKCGTNVGIVDTDGVGRYWVLCYDLKGVGCVETFALPECVEIIEDER